jgi:hypothetical protein
LLPPSAARVVSIFAKGESRCWTPERRCPGHTSGELQKWIFLSVLNASFRELLPYIGGRRVFCAVENAAPYFVIPFQGIRSLRIITVKGGKNLKKTLSKLALQVKLLPDTLQIH